MLPKKFRLSVLQFNKIPQKSNDFSAVFLSIKVKNETTLKFTVSVPKRLDRRSSARNLAKRIIMEAIKKELAVIKKQAYLLVRAKKIILRKDRQAIEREIALLFKKANLL